jgi:hypothetical protein
LRFYDAKFINKSSLFIQLLGVIRRLNPKPISEQKLRINSSPRHIAKFLVVGKALQILQSAFTNTLFFFLLSPIIKVSPFRINGLGCSVSIYQGTEPPFTW